MARLPVARILEPRTVAVFGASDDRSKWAGRIMYYLALHGYAGEVIPINPRRSVVQGKTCYPRIGEAPPVDVAVIAIPAAQIPQTVRECATAGVGCCLIISSGFAEVGAAGAALQADIAEVARTTGMRLIGPNCLGLINVLNGMALTSARVLEVERLHRGAIGFITQSGALMLSVFNRAHDAGIGFSQLVSVGNQADLDVCDFLEHMAGDDATRAICLHIEGLTDGRRLLRLIRQARAAGKAVFVLKTGRSAQGQLAALSHTGSMAGSHPVFAAACRAAGAVLTDDADAMVLAADMATRFGPPPAGMVGIVSSSGGINGIVLDRMMDLGLAPAKFGEATRRALAAYLLEDHLDNPIDLGARRQELGEAMAIAQDIVRTVAADPEVAVTMVPLTTTPHYETTVAALAEALAATAKPGFFIVTPGSVATEVRAIIRARGLMLCDRIDDGLRMLRAWQDCGAMPEPETAAVVSATPPDLPPGYLPEPDTKALLARYGIAVTRERRVHSRDEATAAAEAIGYPVALKAVSARVVHKSDAGLVRLALTDRAALERAYDDVSTALRRLDPEATACLVAEMVGGEFELLLGIKHDAQFGPVVLAGAGGVLAELLQDVAIALAPLTPAAPLAMLRRLRCWKLLEGFRGAPALDVGAVVDTLVRLGRLAADMQGRLGELDINPLFVRAAGGGVVAADARAVVLPR
jgi:acyl-CoA synthetase (NDP forming)